MKAKETEPVEPFGICVVCDRERRLDELGQVVQHRRFDVALYQMVPCAGSGGVVSLVTS